MIEDSFCLRTYFKIIRKFMLTCGLWPYQSKISARIVQFLWSLQHISIMAPEIIKLFESRNNVDHVFESIPPIFYNLVIAILFSNAIIHQREIKNLIEKINKDWENLSDKKEIEILTRYADFGNVITWFYIVSIYTALVAFCTFPLMPFILDYILPLNESRPKFPLYRVQFYVDDEMYFNTILTHAFITSVVGTIPLLAIDALFSNFMQHTCGLLAILGQRLENTMNIEPSFTQIDDKIYYKIIDCITLHKKIIRFIDDICDIFSTAFGILLVILITLTSITGLMVLIKWGSVNDVLRYGLFTIAELFHMLCYSLQCQYLIDHNDDLYKAVGNSGWYRASIKTQMTVKMMFLRCSKPCLIKCFIFTLSMEMFTAVIKTTFSYFTLAKSCIL